MPLPKELTTVTLFSKYLAMILFVAFPFVGFFVGIQYQSKIDQAKQQNNQQLVSKGSSNLTTVKTTSQKQANLMQDGNNFVQGLKNPALSIRLPGVLKLLTRSILMKQQ
jgi:hypothetical protein